jgi:hypothetical protein
MYGSNGDVIVGRIEGISFLDGQWHRGGTDGSAL